MEVDNEEDNIVKELRISLTPFILIAVIIMTGIIVCNMTKCEENIVIEKEKTKQLELQLQIEQQKLED